MPFLFQLSIFLFHLVEVLVCLVADSGHGIIDLLPFGFLYFLLVLPLGFQALRLLFLNGISGCHLVQSIAHQRRTGLRVSLYFFLRGLHRVCGFLQISLFFFQRFLCPFRLLPGGINLGLGFHGGLSCAFSQDGGHKVGLDPFLHGAVHFSQHRAAGRVLPPKVGQNLRLLRGCRGLEGFAVQKQGRFTVRSEGGDLDSGLYGAAAYAGSFRTGQKGFYRVNRVLCAPKRPVQIYGSRFRRGSRSPFFSIIEDRG